jgi:adhesin transport system membrane fusion protein
MSTQVDVAASGESRNGPRVVIWSVVLTLVALGTWASLAEIDQITRANGQIIASSRSQIIQVTEAGVVERMLVKEGQKVVAGELLAVLDQARPTASFMEARAKAFALRAQVVRLHAEIFGKTPVFPADLDVYPTIVEAQRALFSKRQKAINEDIKALQKSLGLAQSELSMNEPLLATGDVSRADLLRLQRQVADLEAQIIGRNNKYFQDTQADLARAEEELAGVTQTLAQRKDSLDRTQLRAPMGGLVKNIRLTTMGAVLKASEELMQIVPSDDTLLVEVRVRPQDVTYLRPGLKANVKIDAYDYTLYGSLDGELVYLSPDTLTEDLRQNEQPYYRARIRTTTLRFKHLPAGQNIELQPGMTSTVEIVTGSNTVLRYLIKPIIKTLAESLSEK